MTTVVPETHTRVVPWASSHRVPTLADLGLNALARYLAAALLAIACILAWMLPHVGLSIAWPTVVPFALGTASVAALLVYFWYVPGKPREWHIPETLTAFLLVILFAQVLMPAQYAGVALRAASFDRQLASADAAFGINVSHFADWTRVHPWTRHALAVAYYSFVPQLALLPPVLGLFLRDREALWEFVFLFAISSTLTVIGGALFPAHAYLYFHYSPTVDMSRPIAHFVGLRAGTFHVIRFNDMDGLVAIPSLHAAVGVLGIWAVRRHRTLLLPMLLLDSGLIAATFLTGTHYVVDAIAGCGMEIACIGMWRAGVWRLARP